MADHVCARKAVQYFAVNFKLVYCGAVASQLNIFQFCTQHSYGRRWTDTCQAYECIHSIFAAKIRTWQPNDDNVLYCVTGLTCYHHFSFYFIVLESINRITSCTIGNVSHGIRKCVSASTGTIVSSMYRGAIQHDIVQSITTLNAKLQWYFRSHDRHPSLALTGELWVSFMSLFGEKSFKTFLVHISPRHQCT